MDGDIDNDELSEEEAAPETLSDDAALDDDLAEDDEDLDEEEDLASHGFHTENEPEDAGY